MKFELIIYGVIAASVLSGCFEAKVEDPADEQGVCTASFVEDSNSLSSVITYLQNNKELPTERRKQELESLRVRCEQFIAKYSDASCDQMVSTADGNVEQQILRTSDLKARCEATLKVTLSPLVPASGSGPQASPEPQAPTTGNQTEIELPLETAFRSLQKDQIRFQIINAQALNSFVKQQGKVLVQGRSGNIGDFREELLGGKTYCVMPGALPGFLKDQKLNLLFQEEHTNQKDGRALQKINFILSDLSQSTLSCGKVSSSPFLISEIQEALSKLISVKAMSKR